MINAKASGRLINVMKKETRFASGIDEVESHERPQKALVDGLDYYLENGLMVFTEHFLRLRGYCCDSDCRHCPYE